MRDRTTTASSSGGGEKKSNGKFVKIEITFSAIEKSMA